MFPSVNKQQASIGSDNVLAPNRQQGIIWPNDGLVYWSIWPQSVNMQYSYTFLWFRSDHFQSKVHWYVFLGILLMINP